ncbi:MAG: hypothetical protein OXL36_16760 [Bryobacterales bacterium]|nr:hypothetical protein [Bryobacterales bacterium]MDE0296105.1 hypothetical protein [Bryobacterales bacterium]
MRRPSLYDAYLHPQQQTEPEAHSRPYRSKRFPGDTTIPLAGQGNYDLGRTLYLHGQDGAVDDRAALVLLWGVLRLSACRG